MGSQGKTRLALAIILLGLVWPIAEPIAARPNQPLAILLLGAGAALLASARPEGSVAFRSLGVAGALAASAVSLVLGIGSTGPARAVCAVAGGLAMAALVPKLKASRLGRGLAAAGVVVLWCGVSGLVLKQVGWRLHDVPVASPGWEPRLGLVAIWTGERLETVRVSFEALGGYVAWFGLAATGAALGLCGTWRGVGRAARSLALGAVVLAAYACLRLAALTALAIEFDEPRLLWGHIFTVVSWLPLALILGPILPGGAPGWVGRRGVAGSRWPVIALAAAGMLAGAALGYNDAGNLKPGRVLFDNSHADWEWTDEPFDTTAFGIRAEYNYYCLRDLVGHFYEVASAELGSRDLSASLLDSVDVLIVRTPTRPYGPGEVRAIVEFVERGGGLLLIGDHTNLFGMSTYLNAIATRFGMRFRLDDTFDLETTGLSTYVRSGVWFHPAARNLDEFQFLTSCTIASCASCAGEAGGPIEPVIVGTGLGSEEVDYGHPNFFGNIAFDLRDRFGIFLQAATRRWGRGRVALFTDSTCFSNFCMSSPGTPELALGLMDYLNRSGTRRPHFRLATLLAACGLVGTVGATRRARAVALSSAGSLGLVAGLVVGFAAVSRLNSAAYGEVQARLPIPVVLFESRHTEASFHDHLGAGSAPRSQRFEELYMCAERAGFHPRRGTIGDLADTGAEMRPKALVIVNPTRPFDKREIERASLYVREGGVLIMLDSITNPRSTANQVLAGFGLEIAIATRTDLSPALEIYDRHAQVQDSGTALLSKRAGLGSVVVATDAFRYSAAVLGLPLSRTRPGESVREVYREVFTLLREAGQDR
ncbi:MAG: DUF4350 domain-containing protein [bacterium]